MAVKDNPENSEDIESNNDAYKLFKESVGTKYYLYLSKEVVSDFNKYIDLLHTLQHEAGQNDFVEIYLANYGGDLHSGLALAHAVKNCKATVLVHALSNCFSMAAILALCGDGLMIYPTNYLMFHNYSGGEVGKADEIESSHKSSMKNWKDMLQYFCKPFFNEEDIKTLLKGQDFYTNQITPTDLKRRLKRHFPRMEVK